MTDFSTLGQQPDVISADSGLEQYYKGHFVYSIFDEKFYHNKGSVWAPLSMEKLRLYLGTKYHTIGKTYDYTDRVIVEIMDNEFVHSAIRVAGCRAGRYIDRKGNPYLVIETHKFIEAKKGKWDLICEILESMFGPEQLPYVYGWLKCGLIALHTRTLAPGQLFIMVGDQGCGKTLVQEKIFSGLFASDSAKCLPYLTDKDQFNSDLMQNFHWVISDAISDFNFAKRKQLTQNIKGALVNTEQRFRGMRTDPIIVNICPRISLSINPADTGSLPLYEDGMKDKMSIFKVNKSSALPNGKRGQLEFERQIREELPAFAYYLIYEHEIPEELKESGGIRFGIKEYHHPEIVTEIQEVKPHVLLAEILSLYCESKHKTTSVLYYSELTDNQSPCKKLIEHVAHTYQMFGRLLTKLEKETEKEPIFGVTVKKRRDEKARYYSIEIRNVESPALLTPAKLAAIKKRLEKKQAAVKGSDDTKLTVNDSE